MTIKATLLFAIFNNVLIALVVGANSVAPNLSVPSAVIPVLLGVAMLGLVRSGREDLLPKMAIAQIVIGTLGILAFLLFR
jgi:hypothetical protein